MKLTPDISLKARNFKCFGDNEQGFEVIKPINILVGRNNAVKSALIDLLESAVSEIEKIPKGFSRHPRTLEILVTQKIPEDSLRRVFPETTSGGGIPGNNHWDFAKRFLGHLICWRLRTPPEHRNLIFLDHPDGSNPFKNIANADRYLEQLGGAQHNLFSTKPGSERNRRSS